MKKALGRNSYSVVDLGCGPGKMTEMLSPNETCISILADALLPMLRVAKRRNPNSSGIASVYEALPFRGETFDAAMAGFAIRDARKLSSALLEINSILKRGGYFLIVDLCKPNSTAKRGLVGFYWRLFAPLIAFFASGKSGLKFAALFTTYRRMPRNSEFSKLVSHCEFEIVQSEYKMLEGACVLLLKKV